MYSFTGHSIQEYEVLGIVQVGLQEVVIQGLYHSPEHYRYPQMTQIIHLQVTKY